MQNLFWFASTTPSRILFQFGPVSIYWYSLCIVLGILAGTWIVRVLYLRDHKDDTGLIDLFFYAVLSGTIGARLWHVFIYQWAYYREHLSEIIKIWHGGIAIHGAIAGGFLAIYFFSRKRKLSPWYWTDIVAPGLALGQAIGRIGNFFNQELYGKPSGLPWAIFINPENRLAGFEQFSRFHPAFAYEAILDFLLCILLWMVAKKKKPRGQLSFVYLFGYGVIRFLVDFIRIDPMPGIGPFRLSQIFSIVLVLASTIGWYQISLRNKKSFHNTTQ